MLKRLGTFGEFVKQYEKARRPYDRRVFLLLKKLIKIKNPKILDLGCGTGISTRQLVGFGKITGCDPDERMLRAARIHKTPKGIFYIKGKGDKLPFKDNSFDVVTAFAAFHWFDDKKSIKEIRRVLKPDGLMFIVNRTGIKKWGEGYRRAIIKKVGQEIGRFKEDDYNPKNSLQKNGFKEVVVNRWKMVELYTVPETLEYVQSVSIWSTVPKEKREEAIGAVKEYFKKILKRHGKIERKLVMQVVSGIK